MDRRARRAHRERRDMTGERRSIMNKIDRILATLEFAIREQASQRDLSLGRRVPAKIR
jgi:hypothetical protein